LLEINVTFQSVNIMKYQNVITEKKSLIRCFEDRPVIAAHWNLSSMVLKAQGSQILDFLCVTYSSTLCGWNNSVKCLSSLSLKTPSEISLFWWGGVMAFHDDVTR
jgi:hypothetical protein